ncbi:hypothetical protein ACH5RR_002320 [Cinchona calisaya]|uniref:Uncharacterized protein n=1 Tax=Cinchona calisaya TaxID=153742 RepID=A0ABD3B7A0_9GENT
MVTSSLTGSNARKDPQEYWNTIMKGEAVPRVIKNRLNQNSESHTGQQFIKNFDTKPNVIIYHHNHVDPQEEKSSAKEVEQFVAKRGKATAN